MTEIDEATLSICALKDAIDQFISVRSFIESGDVELIRIPDDNVDLLVAPRKAIEPSYFIQTLLPFCGPNFTWKNAKKATISPRQVVSGTFGRYPLVDPTTTMDHSDDLVVQDKRNHPQAPRMSQIGPFKLFVAYEGKNRVELFKKFRPQMKAFVSATPYPAPARLSLVKFALSNHWGLEFGDEIQVLPYPEPVLRLLRAYGVSKTRSKVDLQIHSKVKQLRELILAREMRT